MLRQLLESKSASIMPVFAIALTTLVGIVAVSIAIASDSKAVNEIQVTADAAAVAGATAFVTLDTPKLETRLRAAHEEAENFAVANSSYTLTDLDIDTVSEDAYGQQTKIHIEMEFQPANVMARVAGRSGNMAIRRTATAVATWGFPLCILTLSQDGSGLSVEDDAQLESENCIVWTNSTSSNSMEFRGGRMRAQSFCAAGGAIGASRAAPTAESLCNPIPDPLSNWTPPGPGTCQKAPEGFEYTPPDSELQGISAIANSIIDGLADRNGGGTAGMAIAMAEANAFLQTGFNDQPWVDQDGRFISGSAEGLTLEELLQIAGDIDNVNPDLYADDQYEDSATAHITPGTYCGLDVSRGHLEMAPGVYHIKDGPLTVRRRATLTGKGVTIVMSGKMATFSVLDEARLTVSGPVDGNTAGFVLVEDKSRYNSEPENADNGSKPKGFGLLAGLSGALDSGSGGGTNSRNALVSRLTGSGTIDAVGTVYLPHHDLKISGSGAGKQASPLLQIVANRLIMENEGSLQIKFDPTQTEVPVGIKPARTARLVN